MRNTPFLLMNPYVLYRLYQYPGNKPEGLNFYSALIIFSGVPPSRQRRPQQ